MDRNIKISVIIPVYNSEKYLPKCIESVLNQTLQEIEIICVDDGSTDNSLGIIELYASIDSRIRILKQENQFAGVARNNGLKIAQGEYVFFMDSDDFADPTLLQKTYLQGKKCQADIVFFGARRYHTDTNTYSEAKWYFNRDKLPKKEVFNKHDVPDNIFDIVSISPWTKIFRRQFVLEHKLEFQALQNSNDLYFVLLAEGLANRITYVDEDIMNYRVGTQGGIQDTKSKNPLCFLDAYNAVYKDLQERNIYEIVKRSFINAYVSSCNYNMSSYKDRITKKIVYQAVMENNKKYDFMEYDSDYYYNKNFYNNVSSARFILEFMDYQENTFENDSKCIKSAKISYKPKVSVIIPIYNVQKYVKKTLESIRKQSLQEIEIICINDGSTDNSLEVVSKIAEDDIRITLYTQKNKGLSFTRNMGAKQASGQYIYFMDSDDLLDINALEKLYDKATENNLDILLFDADSFFDVDKNESYKEYYHRSKQYSGIYNGKDLFKEMVVNDDYRASACLQLIKREYYEAKNLSFLNGILHEDNAFSMLLRPSQPDFQLI